MAKITGVDNSVNNSQILSEVLAKKASKVSSSKAEKTGDSSMSSAVSSNYDVTVSDEAKRLADSRKLAFDIAKNTSPVREEKVEQLKQKILSGEYTPSASDIADGIIKDAWYDKLALDLHDQEKMR